MILVWCNSKQDRERVVMLVTKAPSNSTTKHLFLIHHFSTFCDNHLNPANTGFLPVSLLRYFLSLPISLMTWGGLTTMCILPYAWSCQPPTCMNCQRSNRHNPQPSSYLQTLPNVFVELLEELEWLKYIHVCLTVGVEIMFAHALSFSQCLRKKKSSVFTNL